MQMKKFNTDLTRPVHIQHVSRAKQNHLAEENLIDNSDEQNKAL